MPLPCQPPQGYTVHTPAVGCYVGGGSRWRKGNERAAVTPVCMCVKCVWGGEVCGCGCVSGCGCMCVHACVHTGERGGLLYKQFQSTARGYTNKRMGYHTNLVILTKV